MSSIWILDKRAKMINVNCYRIWKWTQATKIGAKFRGELSGEHLNLVFRNIGYRTWFRSIKRRPTTSWSKPSLALTCTSALMLCQVTTKTWTARPRRTHIFRFVASEQSAPLRALSSPDWNKTSLKVSAVVLTKRYFMAFVAATVANSICSLPYANGNVHYRRTGRYRPTIFS